MNLYPLIMTPHFRHGAATPWGGYALRDIFMKEAPGDATGESLEVSTLPEQESLVSNGPQAAKTLSRLAEVWGAALTGVEGGAFPLWLSLVDAGSDIAINPGFPGMPMAWVVLNAEPGAKLLSGGEWRSVRPGDVYYVPIGAVQTLGAGVQLYAICGDMDAAADVADTGAKLTKNEGTTVLCRGGSRTYYVSDAAMELCRLNLSGTMPLESGRPLLLTPMGGCEIRWGSESLFPAPFQTVVIPAGLEGVTLVGNTKILMAAPSDRPALREALGYRAENVAGLMDT